MADELKPQIGKDLYIGPGLRYLAEDPFGISDWSGLPVQYQV